MHIKLSTMFETANLWAKFHDRRRSEMRRRLGILHDIIMCAVAFIAANVIAVGIDNFNFLGGFPEKVLLFSLLSTVICYLFELNSGSWRYASIPDLVAIAKSATVSVLAYVLLIFLYSRGEGLPRVSLILLWFFMITLLAGPRIFYRVIREGGLREALTGIGSPDDGENAILIYKINDVTEAYIRSVRTRDNPNVFIAGVVDDIGKRDSRTVQGLRIVGRLTELKQIVERQRLKHGIKISSIFVADHSLTRDKLGQLVEKAAECVHVFIAGVVG